MKIMVVATTFPRYKGDKIPQFLLGYTRSLVEAGASVTVIAPHDTEAKEYEIMDGVEVRRVVYWLPKAAQNLCYGAGIPTNVRRQKWVSLQFPALEVAMLTSILRYGRDADILNPHWTFASTPTAIAAKLLNKPMITHAYTAEFIPKVLNPFNKFVINNSAAVISISDYTAKLVDQTSLPKRHEVIGYGVNPEKIAPAEFDVRKFRSQQGIKPDQMLVLAVGRLVERKGYTVLIDAIAKMISKGVPVRLLHSGQGPLRNQLQSQINKYGINDKVTLLGFVPDEQLKYYIKSADALVMPSIMDQSQDTEGLGVPLLEAMANDTPAIGSAIAGILSIIKDGENGLLVEPGNAGALADTLEKLHHDQELRDHLIRGGRETIKKKYSWSKIAQRILAIFEDCL